MSGEKRERPRLTVMLVPEGGQESRTFRISYLGLRILGTLGAVMLVLAAGSGWYLAVRASRVPGLEARVRSLEVDSARVESLATELEAIERQYTRIRDMFGARPGSVPADPWVPPPGAARGATPRTTVEASVPSSWPLTERGFVTQGLMDAEGGQGEHPGLDIAVPTDSYVRAAGAGMVVDVGEDDVYGRFVVVDHGEGYTTIYGHASLNLVVRGQRVRQNEVIALSGSTGRSTAPHLHFEVLLNGRAVDPLTLIQQP